MSLSVARYFGGNVVYRIALIGETDSGKTCLLAALGANPDKDAAGNTCLRLNQLPGRDNPPDREVVAALAQDRRVRRDPVLAFHGARVRLDEADRAMREGNRPRPTPANAPPLLAVYTFSAPGRGGMTVEVAEYSGELLNPVETTAAVSRRQVLALFAACDAILLLADAPRRDEPATGSRPFQHLLGAFHEWATRQGASARVRKPVAVVFAKWDRRVGPDASAEETAAELDRLTKESAAHGGLVAGVKNVCQTTATFALSAFGRHAVRPTAETPATNAQHDHPLDYPSSSYGLHAPFVWACAECDRLDRETLPARAEELRWRRVLDFRSSGSTKQQANRVRSHSHEGEPLHAVATQTYNRARRVQRVQLLLGAAVVVGVVAKCLYVGGVYHRAHEEKHVHDERDRELARDRSELNWAELALTTADTTDDQFDNACRWYRDYAGSADDKHVYAKRVLLSPDQARGKVQAAVAAREERAWQRADVKQPDPVREPALQHYLTKYPTGQHADEARQALAEISERRKCETLLAGYRKNLEAVQSDFAAAKPKKSLPELEKVRTRWLELPPPGPCGAGEYATGRQRIGDEIKDEIVKVIGDVRIKEWYAIEDRYKELLRKGDLAGAATELNRCAIPLPQVAEAKARFAAVARETATARRNWVVQERRLENATVVEGQLRTAIDSPDFTARTDVKTRNHLEDLAKELRKWRDQALYEVFTATPNVTNAKNYLDLAPLKNMKDSVQAYLDYEASRVAPRVIAVGVTVHWANWYDDKVNDIELQIYDRESGSWKQRLLKSKVKSAAQKSTDEFESDQFWYKPTDPLGVYVRVQRSDGTYAFTTRLHAELSWEQSKGKTPEELHTPKQFDLVQKNKDVDCKASVSLRVLNVPQMPELPAWKE